MVSNVYLLIAYCISKMSLVCSCALIEDIHRLRSDMIEEQKKLRFDEDMLETTHKELESIQVFRYFDCR